MTIEPWVSVEDTAKHLGVAADSIYRWAAEGRIPAHKAGRLWKFKLSEVDAWMMAGGTKTKAATKKVAKRSKTR